MNAYLTHDLFEHGSSSLNVGHAFPLRNASPFFALTNLRELTSSSHEQREFQNKIVALYSFHGVRKQPKGNPQKVWSVKSKVLNAGNLGKSAFYVCFCFDRSIGVSPRYI